MQDLLNDHAEKVAAVQQAVREARRRGQQIKIYHGSTNSTRPFEASAKTIVDVSSLNRVLEISETGQYAVVEPGVPLDALVDATLAHGLVPPVIAEFPGITVGGAVQGGSGESSSFRYGLCFRLLRHTYVHQSEIGTGGEVCPFALYTRSECC